MFFMPIPISAPPVHINSAPVQNVASVARNKHAFPISSVVPKRLKACKQL